MKLNLQDKGIRRYILIQLPETCDEKSDAFKAGYQTIADIGKDRIRKSAQLLQESEDSEDVDFGFKVFKLSNSNIQAWNPDRTDLEETLLSHQEHLLEGRSEQDVLYELLLKRGVDLAVPIESRDVAGKNIYSIGYGVLFACLDESITREEVENIAQVIIDWHSELAPASETHVFFRDSAFRDDVSKTNMAAILEQNGITHVRSL
jgi:adenine-specific DNA-methyltransferase